MRLQLLMASKMRIQDPNTRVSFGSKLGVSATIVHKYPASSSKMLTLGWHYCWHLLRIAWEYIVILPLYMQSSVRPFAPSGNPNKSRKVYKALRDVCFYLVRICGTDLYGTASVYRALADEPCSKVVLLLWHSCCVSELVRVLAISESAVSQHSLFSLWVQLYCLVGRLPRIDKKSGRS